MKLALSREMKAMVRTALREDTGSGDATTLATVPASSRSTAVMAARVDLCASGLALAVQTFRETCSFLEVCQIEDGTFCEAGTVMMRLRGDTRGLLTGERVALNFVQHLSGIATLTRQFVVRTRGTKARILDTRKTLPGWRKLAKYAVACGGGQNHRFGLHDMVLIKDNHLAALKNARPNPIAAAIRRARQKYPKLKVEVEADHLAQARQAAEAGADIILLDNMKPPRLAAAVRMIAGRAKTEASGGVTLSTVRAIAESGVDYISIGALTHSAPAVDIGLDFL